MNSACAKEKLAGGLFFLFLFHSAVQISTFGWTQGTYFWFCNLALFLGSLAIFFQRKDLVTVLLSVLIPTQFFWIFDHLKRSITGTDFFGVTEALYHPGVSTLGFLIGHYHYFLIPVLLYAFFSMPDRKPQLLKSLLILALGVIPLSRYLFPEDQNINCTVNSCFENLPSLQGSLYTIVFVLILLLICFGTGFLLTKKLQPVTISEKKNRTIFMVLIVVGLCSTGLGYFRKQRVPKFACNGPYENEVVKVRCDFLTEHIQDWMVLHYELENKTDAVQECSSFIEFEGKKELFQDGLTIEAKSPLKLSILIHYPAKDTKIDLSATCKTL